MKHATKSEPLPLVVAQQVVIGIDTAEDYVQKSDHSEMKVRPESVALTLTRIPNP